MKNEKMMREAPVWQLLLKMSLPTVVIMLMNVVYNMADTFFMGQTGDAMQVAGVSLAGPVFSVFSGVGVLLGSGACTAIAISLGQGDKAASRRYTSFCFWCALALGVLCGAALLLFLDPVVGFLGANAETAAHTAAYLRVMALGAPAMIVSSVLGNAIRADGSATSPMLVCIGGNLINIVLDALFILAFRWGAAGAALATVFGNLFSLVCVLFMIRRREGFSISPKHFTWKPSVSLRVLSLGLPMAAGVILQSFSGVFSNRLTVKYGNLAVAAGNVAGKSGMLLGMVVMGVCMGIQPAISYVFGTGDRRRMRKILWGIGVASTVLSLGVAAVFILCRDSFVAAFLNDPQVIELGRFMMLGSLVTAPLYGILQLCSTYLQGTGKVSYATVAALMQKGLVYVPVLYGMEAVWGFNGLVFAAAVSDLISTLAAAALSLHWGAAPQASRAETSGDGNCPAAQKLPLES